MNTDNLNILITGASSGIGEALAIHYAKKSKCHLFLCGRNEKRLQNVKETCLKYGANVDIKVIDVTDRKLMNDWIIQCNKKAELNLIFANAGISTGIETSENIYNTFNTNIFGVLNTIIPAIDIYRQSKASKKIIAITSSIAGYHGLSSCPSYSATKSCIKAYGEALRAQLQDENIQVNVICPGFVKSRITDKNTCPMPFFMSAEKAANIIAHRIDKNIGLISFPWQMRFVAWFVSILPNAISNFIYAKLPHKV